MGVKFGHWLAAVDGQPPEYPYTELVDTPEGYTWDDILYVIGGYGWKMQELMNTMSLSAAIQGSEPFDSDLDPTGSS